MKRQLPGLFKLTSGSFLIGGRTIFVIPRNHLVRKTVCKCESQFPLKARSHDLILRIRFLGPKIGSRRSDGPISRFRFCGENVGRCVYKIRFSELTKNLQFGAKTITGISCKICRRLLSFKKNVG